MKSLKSYIQEKLIINKDYVDVNISTPKSFDELRKIIEDRYNKLGAGTKQNPIDFNDIDASNLDSFCNDNENKGIFAKTKFKYIDISDWDVSNVKSTDSMFYNCVVLKSVGDVSNWDVSNVTNMYNMFYCCKNFDCDLSNWNVSKVRYRTGIFDGCPIKNEYKPKFK